MKYLSVCSGIEAATVAWHGLEWKPAGFSEIEKFPSQVLAHHYPTVRNFGDMTRYKEWDIETNSIGLLVGGTPCQSFSVAGLRKGLDDPRGNLALVYCGMLDHFRPQWFVWENVPGVLSSSGGRDFGSFLGALAELGYGFAYRVLDAQFFGVAQRRRRVFVVGYLGDWRPPASVLFERESLRRDTAPCREKGKKSADTFAQCFEPRSPDGHARLIGDFSPTLNRMGGGQREPCVMYPGDLSGTLTARSVTSLGAPEVDGNQFIPMYMGNAEGGAKDKPFLTRQNLSAGISNQSPLIVQGTQDPCVSDIAFAQGRNNEGENVLVQPTTQYGSVAGSLTARHDSSPCADRGANVLAQSMAVRRLTPVECERLQGFPDNYTNIKNPTPDGPRYKALGNSMAVPVMRWIGERINAITSLSN
jgi:DNA (cytosine-5)-methyltransferase 1